MITLRYSSEIDAEGKPKSFVELLVGELEIGYMSVDEEPASVTLYASKRDLKVEVEDFIRALLSALEEGRQWRQANSVEHVKEIGDSNTN